MDNRNTSKTNKNLCCSPTGKNNNIGGRELNIYNNFEGPSYLYSKLECYDTCIYFQGDHFLENIYPSCSFGTTVKGKKLLPEQANSSL